MDLHRRHRTCRARGSRVATHEQRKLELRQRWSTTACAPDPVWRRMAVGSSTTTPPTVTGHFELWWIKGALTVRAVTTLLVTTNLDFDASSPPSWVPLSSVPVDVR